MSGEALAQLVQKISRESWLQLGLQDKNVSVAEEQKVSCVSVSTSPDNSCLS